MKYASRGSLIGTIISKEISYFHMHSFCSSSFTSLRRVHHIIVLFVLFGLSSITWSGHCIHIAYPANGLLDAAIDPVVIWGLIYITSSLIALQMRRVGLV